MLKDHAGRCAKGRELTVASFGANAFAKSHLAVPDANMSAIGVFEQVDAAQQCRFARTARPDDRDNRAALDA